MFKSSQNTKLVKQSSFQFPEKGRRKHNNLLNKIKKAEESKPKEISDVITDDSYSNDKFEDPVEDEENVNSSSVSSIIVDNNSVKTEVSIEREKVRFSR